MFSKNDEDLKPVSVFDFSLETVIKSRGVCKLCSVNRALEEELKNSFLGLLALSVDEFVFKWRKVSVMNQSWHNFSKIENILLSYFR